MALAEAERAVWTARRAVKAAVPPTLAEIGRIAVYAADWATKAEEIAGRAEELRQLVIEIDGARLQANLAA